MPNSSITPIEEASTSRSAIPSGSPRPESRPRSEAVGDSYDNALAENVIGLFKTEIIERRGPWRGLEPVEHATLEWVDWYNNQRLLSSIGYVPPVELEQGYYQKQAAGPGNAGLN